MHDLSCLGIAHQQLAENLCQWRNVAGHCRRHLEECELRELERITEHTMFASTALHIARHRQHEPDGLPGAWNKICIQELVGREATRTKKLALLWLTGVLGVGGLAACHFNKWQVPLDMPLETYAHTLAASRPEAHDLLRLLCLIQLHQPGTHEEALAMEAQAATSAREGGQPDAQATRSRHTTTLRHFSRNTDLPFVRLRFSPVHGESEQPSSQINIDNAPHDHQTPLPEEMSPAWTVQLASSQEISAANILHRIRPCYFLVALGFLVIGGSLAVGLYYSIAKDRMGDGFTTAGWMTAVGTLILAAPMAKHYPHCKCWKAGYTVLRHGHNTQV